MIQLCDAQGKHDNHGFLYLLQKWKDVSVGSSSYGQKASLYILVSIASLPAVLSRSVNIIINPTV